MQEFVPHFKIIKMHTLPPTFDENANNEPDVSLSEQALLLAYGRKVRDLLSQSNAATWINDLWDMYTGYTAFSQECGFDHRGHERFVSFKELVFFFREITRINEEN